MIATVEKDEIGPFLQVLTDRAGNLEAPIEKTLESGLGDAQQTVTAGGPDFGWPPHSPWTAKVDVALGRSRKGMLNEKGALLGSLARGGSGNVFEAGPDSGRAGTAVTSPRTGYAYGKDAQEGRSKSFNVLQWLRSVGRDPGRRILIHGFNKVSVPPRTFLWWHEEKFPEYDRFFLDHVMGAA